MTVAELIERLRAQPQEAAVFLDFDADGMPQFALVERVGQYADGDVYIGTEECS